MIDFDEILREYNNNIVFVGDSIFAVIRKDENGKAGVYRMCRCSLGDYFAILSWLIDEYGGPSE